MAQELPDSPSDDSAPSFKTVRRIIDIDTHRGDTVRLYAFYMVPVHTRAKNGRGLVARLSQRIFRGQMIGEQEKL